MRSFPRAEWKEFYAATHKLFTKFVGVSPHDALMVSLFRWSVEG
jgi:hypothetical protein